MTCSDRNVKSIFLVVAEMTSFFNLGWKNLKIWQNLGRSKDFGETFTVASYNLGHSLIAHPLISGNSASE